MDTKNLRFGAGFNAGGEGYFPISCNAEGRNCVLGKENMGTETSVSGSEIFRNEKELQTESILHKKLPHNIFP